MLRYQLTPQGVIVLADEQGRPRQTITANKAWLRELCTLANLALAAREAAKARREDYESPIVDAVNPRASVSLAGPI